MQILINKMNMIITNWCQCRSLTSANLTDVSDRRRWSIFVGVWVKMKSTLGHMNIFRSYSPVRIIIHKERSSWTTYILLQCSKLYISAPVLLMNSEKVLGSAPSGAASSTVFAAGSMVQFFRVCPVIDKFGTCMISYPDSLSSFMAFSSIVSLTTIFASCGWLLIGEDDIVLHSVRSIFLPLIAVNVLHPVVFHILREDAHLCCILFKRVFMVSVICFFIHGHID